MKIARVATAMLLSVVLMVGCVNIGSLISLGTQIALDIIQIIAAFQGHAQAADIAAAQSIGNEASKDWQDLVNAYNAYEKIKTPGALNAVVAAGSVLENDLATALADAHIKDPVLAGRIQVAVSTIITVVDSIAADLGTTIPVSSTTTALKASLVRIPLGSPHSQRRALISVWNHVVLAPTGMADVDAALAKSRL